MQWPCVIDAIQGVDFGMILLQTLSHGAMVEHTPPAFRGCRRLLRRAFRSEPFCSFPSSSLRLEVLRVILGSRHQTPFSGGLRRAGATVAKERKDPTRGERLIPW